MYTLDINELECRRLSQAVGVGPDELISTFFFRAADYSHGSRMVGWGVNPNIFFVFIININHSVLGIFQND